MLDFPLPDKPESINHGSSDGFNFGGSLGFVYEAMGVHSSVICGKKQVEDVGREEMVSCNAVLHEPQLCVSACSCMTAVLHLSCITAKVCHACRHLQSLQDRVACLPVQHLRVHSLCSHVAVVCVGHSNILSTPQCPDHGLFRTDWLKCLAA